MIYRTKGDQVFKNFGKYRSNIINEDEWLDDDRTEEAAWQHRYDYESNMILDIIKENNYSKILELGSGPGVLGQKIMSVNNTLDYTYVDKIEAKNTFNSKNYKGKFIVKDLFNYFDIENELDSDYDFVIANDFLEHIANPSDVLYKATLITKKTSGFLISVPNWRMGHFFIYRGLFDYDNFLYFCTIHGWIPKTVFQSPLQCAYSPKLSSESSMDDKLITSWNWYIYCEKTNED